MSSKKISRTITLYALSAFYLFATGCNSHEIKDVRVSKSQPYSVDEGIALFQRGDLGYFGFRIPVIVKTERNVLLAFAEGRRNDMGDHGHIDIVLRRSFDGGKSWEPVQIVQSGGMETAGNPCAVVDRRNNRVHLLFCRNNREVFVTHSDDDGATWSPARDITSDVKDSQWKWYATGPGIGIQTRSGRLMIPCNHNHPGKYASSTSHVIYSDDGGEKWVLGGSLPRPQGSPSSNEAQIAEIAKGEILLNARISSKDPEFQFRGQSISKDEGQSWSLMEVQEQLIDPTCQAALIALDGDSEDPPALLLSNPKSNTLRRNMHLSVSHDGGRSWNSMTLIDEGFSGYSGLVELDDGNFGIFYERGFKVEDLVFSSIERSH